MVICLGRGADLHMAQLMPLPLTISCFSKIQIGSGTSSVIPDKVQRDIKRMCVCMCVVIPTLGDLTFWLSPWLSLLAEPKPG